MTRFLHTADLHLAEGRPERWASLEAVLETGRDRNVDALLVAGDLLDRSRGGAALRRRVREALESVPFPVFLIPGNHDRDAYAAGQDWGPRTRLLLEEPAQAAEGPGGLRVVGVPFPSEPVSFRRLLPALTAAIHGTAPAVVLLHGTLIETGDPTILAETQDDEGGRYFPFRLDDLASLDAAYVALGHYHQTQLRSPGEGPVAYAGSPSPVGSHARGPRQAVLVDLDDGGTRTETVRLPVPFRDRMEAWIRPFEEEASLESLASDLEARSDPACELTVRVDGILTELTETGLRERLQALGERHADAFRELAVEVRGVGLEPELADLFRDFRRRVDRLDDDREIFEEIARDRSRHAHGIAPEEIRQRALQLAARALRAAT